ncbi:MAG: hypothetical protein KDB95_04250 [Flavobacteriales bacterium]|nr:hypothetical protein [Flavobacteriales bacterium]
MSGILLAAAYTALLLYWMHRTRFYSGVPGLRFHWVAAFFLFRIAAGVALWAIYTYVYPDRATADVFKYFDDSAYMFNALAERPVDYLRMITGIGNDNAHFHELYYRHMNNWVRHYESNLYNDAHTIIRFNALVRLVSFGEFHVHTVASAFLSLTGLLGIYHAFVRALPGKEKLLAAAVFLVPSVVFWASGVIKESLLFFGIGLLVYQADRMLRDGVRWQDPFLLAFNVAMLFFLKVYVLLSLFPALLLLFWARIGVRPPLWLKVILVYGPFIALGLNLQHLLPGWDILGILTMKQRDFVGLAIQMNSGSFVMPELLLPDVWLFVKQAPYALGIALFGPVLHPGGGALGLLSAAENVGILLFLITCFMYRKPWAQVDRALLAALMGYVILLALVIGWTTPVMGAVVRYRTPLLPFLLIGGLVLLDHARLMARWPWARRFFAA